MIWPTLIVAKYNIYRLSLQEELREQKNQVTQRQDTQKKSESSVREKETMIKNLNSEVESLQRLSTSESSELKDRFNKELSNLTSQFTTEMGEMQQRFSIEKEEMEQEFLVKCKELEADHERKNAENVSELKACFKDEKDLLVSETGVEKSELESEFQKQKQMLETFYAEEMDGEKRKHSEEMAKLGEVIEVLRQEKKQLQTFFEKEKVDIGEQFAAEKEEIEQVWCKDTKCDGVNEFGICGRNFVVLLFLFFPVTIKSIACYYTHCNPLQLYRY